MRGLSGEFRNRLLPNSPLWGLDPLCELISQSEVVVYGDLGILFGVQLPFGGLDGGVSQQKLNLL
jgi:hypothetical protein